MVTFCFTFLKEFRIEKIINVFKICNEKNIDYYYENTKSGFRFTFYRPLGHKNVQDMSETEKKVYELIKNDNYIKANVMAKKISKSEKTVYRSIKKLKEYGMIKRIGDDYEGHWEICHTNYKN